MAKAGIIARDSGGTDFEQPVAGSYIARCYKLVDMGTLPQTFQGKESAPKRRLMAWFELLEDEEGNEYRDSDGNTFSIMNEYTLSTNAKARLRQHIDAWRGKALTKEEAEEFDVTNLLGTSCRLQVALSESQSGDRTYTNIATLGYTKKDPKGVRETSWWTIDDPDQKMYNDFPEFLQKKIATAEEWGRKPVVSTDDVPVDAKGHINSKGDMVIEELDEDPIDVKSLKF